jgi:hypothetical protein
MYNLNVLWPRVVPMIPMTMSGHYEDEDGEARLTRVNTEDKPAQGHDQGDEDNVITHN